jgi:hypothetical protein
MEECYNVGVAIDEECYNVGVTIDEEAIDGRMLKSLHY